MELAAAEEKIVSFIRDIVSRSGTEGVVIGLSGGIDSSLVAALCVRALGRQKVLGFFCYESERALDSLDADKDLQDVCGLAGGLGIELLTIDLSPALKAASEAARSARTVKGDIAEKIGPETNLSKGNLRARLRMSVLYYYANHLNRLVAGTTNKTELLTGYYTKYGDGGVDIEPIGDLYKTEVRALSRFIGLPEAIIEKTPSAGFWEGQSDEADLGISYADLDTFLHLAADRNLDRKTVIEETGIDEKQYDSLLMRLSAGEHKRKMPPIPPVH